MPRTVVLSDIHGNLPALRTAWLDASHRQADHVLFLGDLVAFGPHPVEVIEYLRDTVQPEVALRGNTDRYLIDRVWEKDDCGLPKWARESLAWTADRIGKEGLAFLEGLVAEQDYDADGVPVYLCHASPGNDESGVAVDDAHAIEDAFAPHEGKIVLCGHTHWPYRTGLSGASVINVGSVGLPFDRDQRASFLSFMTGGEQLRELSLCRASYPVHGTIADLETSEMPGADVVLHRLRTASSGLPRGYESEGEGEGADE